jgi:hypothetical protein
VTEDDQRWRHELERQDQQRALDQARQHHDRLDEIGTAASKAAIDSANLVFRTAVLINGGAAVSVLAFAGGLISQGKLGLGPQTIDVSVALVLFALGVLAGGLGLGSVYFNNFCITGVYQSRARQWDHPYVVETPISRRWAHGATFFLSLAIACGVGTAILFVCGVLKVRSAITQPVVQVSPRVPNTAHQ